MSASISDVLESKIQLTSLFRLFSTGCEDEAQLAKNLRWVYDQPSHIYQLMIHICAINKNLAEEEVRATLDDLKVSLREYELEELLAIERQKAQKIQTQIWLLNFELFEEFLTKLRGHKAMISASCGGDKMELTLWRDPRASLAGIEIPAQIGTAPVTVKWIDCHVPAPQSWTVPIGDIKSNFGNSYRWLKVRASSYGVFKTMTINSHHYEKEFDGTTLRISAKKMYNPAGAEHLVLHLSTFGVPVWIRNVVITCTYTDPLA